VEFLSWDLIQDFVVAGDVVDLVEDKENCPTDLV
jgi:hypothetical protein